MDFLGKNILPQYWNLYIAQRLEQLKKLDELIDSDGDVLAFISDVHWLDNAKYSPMLLDVIKQNTKLEKLVCGGDLLTCHSKSEAISVLKESISAYQTYFGNQFYYVNGNHDNNPYKSEVDKLTYEEQYQLCMKHLEGSVVQQEQGENGFHYYFDNVNSKIRYIVLDTKNMYPIFHKQYKWFAEEALDLADDWSVAVFMHWAYNLNKKTNQNAMADDLIPIQIVTDILKAVKNKSYYQNEEFDIEVKYNNNVDVLFIASGHTHTDGEFAWSGEIFPQEDSGIVSFTVSSDAFRYCGWTPHAKQVFKTTGEQCFDIIHIDKLNRKVYLSRIGFGSDRFFSY